MNDGSNGRSFDLVVDASVVEAVVCTRRGKYRGMCISVDENKGRAMQMFFRFFGFNNRVPRKAIPKFENSPERTEREQRENHVVASVIGVGETRILRMFAPKPIESNEST
jgi:hypothetical protein